MPQPNKIPLAFAASGDKNTIPESTETTGLASWREGFPAITSAPFSEGGIAPKRADFNGIFNALSQAVMWMQQGGVYAYDVNTDYEAGNVVLDAGGLYVANAANGPSSAVVQPSSDTTGTTWKLVRLDLATQSAAGYMSAADKAALDGVPTTYLPRSGGTLTGVLNTKDIYIDNAAIRAIADTQSTILYGGVGWAHGAQGVFYGKDDANKPGNFALRADNGTLSKTLIGKPDGTLTWDSKDVATILTGTWTPELANFSFTTRTATYVKIGKVVFIKGHIVGSFSSLPSQMAYLSGLPFETGVDEHNCIICHATGGVNGSAKRIIHGVATYSNLRLYAISSRSTTDGCGQIGYANFSQSSNDEYYIYFNASNITLDLWFSGSYIATA